MMTFCEKCREMVAYKTENVPVVKEIKGKLIKFKGKTATCPICKCALFVPGLRDYNLLQLNIAYRN